jgi:hypothetical protein
MLLATWWVNFLFWQGSHQIWYFLTHEQLKQRTFALNPEIAQHNRMDLKLPSMYEWGAMPVQPAPDRGVLLVA